MAGEDYLPVSLLEILIPGGITMNNTATCMDFTFLVIDDKIVEFPETFLVEILYSDPPVMIGDPSCTTITILDDDSKSPRHA